MKNLLYHLILTLTPILAYSQRCIFVQDHNQQEISTTINCGFNFTDSCVRLDSQFPPLKDTDRYLMSTSAYNPFENYSTGIAINANDDDHFIKRINFNEIGGKPFLFNFFGQKQDSFIISSNGFISFDSTYQPGDFSTPDLNNQPIPSNYLPKSSIFGSFQDLSFYSYLDSEIYMNVSGEYPCRTLAINFYKGIIAGTDQTSTFQIVLHEMTSQIDINVAQKPTPAAPARFKASLIGITDENGNGIAPVNRNTNIWEANNESYTFVADGNTLSPQHVSWTNTIQQVLPDGFSLSICQIVPTTYTATATYRTNRNSSFTIENEHQILVDADYPIAKDYVYNICDISTSLTQSSFYHLVNAQPNPTSFVYKFYTNRNDAQNNLDNSLERETLLNYKSIYYVRIEHPNDANCFQIAQLTINDSFEFPSFVEICDNNNDGIENYNLQELNCKIFEHIPDATNIRYYVDNSNTPSTTFNLTNTSTIYVKFDTANCQEIRSNPIAIRFIDAPFNLVDEINIESYEELFDIVTNNNSDQREYFNWIEYLEGMGIQISTTSLENAKVFQSLNDAKTNNNPVDYIAEGKANNDYRYTWYLRIDNQNTDCNGNCYSIIPIQLRVKFRKLILNIHDADTDSTPDQPHIFDKEVADVYFCATQNYTLNLEEDVRRIFIITTHRWEEVTVTYHTNYTSANDLSSTGITPMVTTNNYSNKNYYVRIALNDKDYVIKQLKYHFIPTAPLKQQFDICVENTTTTKNIRLADYLGELIDRNYLNLSPNPIVEFYTDENAQNRITHLQVGRTYSRIWVKIRHTIAENLCEGFYPLDFKLVSIENILKNYHEVNLVCDNNLDGIEILNLKNYIGNYVTDQSLYQFGFYTHYDASTNTFSGEITNPENYQLDGDRLIYIAISSVEETNICSQKVELKINFNPDPARQIYANQEAHLVICNQINTSSVEFNLKEAIPQFFTNREDYEEYITNVQFYENYNDAFTGNENFIEQATTYTLLATQPHKVIYVRFENSYGCFNIKPLNLTILGFIKFKNNLSFDVCDINFDGLYEFEPQQWIDAITQDEDTSNDLLTDQLANRFATYSIYLTEQDYRNGNAIAMDQTIRLDPTLHRTIIVAGEINGGCDDHIAVKVNYNETIVHHFEMDPICDDQNDRMETIDLRIYENEFPNANITYYRSIEDLRALNNAIEHPSHYNFNSEDGEYIYAKIEHENSCASFAKIKATLLTQPIISIPDFEICLGEMITINPDYLHWSIHSYEWRNSNGEIISTTPSLTTDQIGDYQIILTSANGCSSVTTFTIRYKPMPNFIAVVVHNQNITVEATGTQRILYSMDQINWQDSNTFENLGFGPFDVYLKYADSDCIIGPFRTVIPKIYNTISPNGDGINEKWILEDMDVFNGQKAELQIFDRYGKVIYTQQSNTQLIWDGKTNGKPLPSTSYWYTIKFPDGRKYTGYINVLNKY